MSNTIFIEPKCKICGQCFKSLAPVGKHLKLKHNISVEIYYKQYIDNTEYKCLTCNKSVSFISLTLGYRKFCCSTCASQNKTWLLNREKTYIKKYGAKSYTATDECKNKIKQTCLKKYGVENYSQTEEYKNRCKQTCLEKYGVEYYTQAEEYKEQYKQTCLEKYGVENYAQTEECFNKIKQTCLEKYGVTSINQVYDIICKQHSKFKINNKIYDSKWEYLYEQYLIKNNINYIYHPNISFEYYYNNEKHFYFPDFIINNNELIEIKGLYFFEGFNASNKMINPYNRNLDDLAEAKHQCMIKNNIKIITDIKPYI